MRQRALAAHRSSTVASSAAARRLTRGLATPTSGSGAYPPAPSKHYDSITPPYEHLLRQLEQVRQHVRRPLSLAEKIVYSHLVNVEEGLAGGDPIRGEKHLKLRPDRVALQGKQRSILGATKEREPRLIQAPATFRCLGADGDPAILDVWTRPHGRAGFDSL